MAYAACILLGYFLALGTIGVSLLVYRRRSRAREAPPTDAMPAAESKMIPLMQLPPSRQSVEKLDHEALVLLGRSAKRMAAAWGELASLCTAGAQAMAKQKGTG